MRIEDYPRIFQAIDYAVQSLESEAKCYCYSDEPEHKELIAYLKKHKEKLVEQEKREYYVLKANTNNE